jgi:hypothetical protein
VALAAQGGRSAPAITIRRPQSQFGALSPLILGDLDRLSAVRRPERVSKMFPDNFKKLEDHIDEPVRATDPSPGIAFV